MVRREKKFRDVLELFVVEGEEKFKNVPELLPGAKRGLSAVSGLLLLAAHGALDVAPGLPLRDVVPLVVEFLSPAEADLELDARALEVELQRDEGQSPLLRLPEQVVDLLPLEEKLAGAQRIDFAQVAVRVRRDVHVLDEGLAPLDHPVGV